MSSIVYFPKKKGGLFVKFTIAPNRSIHILYDTSLNFQAPTSVRIPHPMSKGYASRFRNKKKFTPIYVPNVPRR